MILTGAHYEKAVGIIASGLDLNELERVARYLDYDIDDIAGDAGKSNAVYKLLLWCDRRNSIPSLFQKIAAINNALDAELASILEEARQRAATVDPNRCQQADDPLASFFINKEPFIDRAGLDEKLTELWTLDGVLVVRGNRGYGRSHSWWRIRSSAARSSASAHYIDLSKDPGYWTVSALVDRITVWLAMPVTNLKDRLAQESKLSNLFAVALGTHLRTPEMQHKRWCLVLDGLDRTGISKEIIELVQALAEDILAGNLANFSLVFLGYGRTSHWNFEQMILEEEVELLEHSHVTDFLDRVTKAVGKPIASREIDEITRKIFDGLEQPCIGQTLSELKKRVRKHSIELMRRA